MPRTPASGDTPYASADDIEDRFDVRVIRQLLSDTNSPVTGSLASNAKLLAALQSASGEVESAACAGQRYVIDESQNDLDSLTGNSQALLKRIVCGLAYYDLWSRRPNVSANDQLPPQVKDAREWLERLRLGERVFGILVNHQAAALEANIESPIDVQRRNGSVSAARRYFGARTRDLTRPS